MVYECKFDTDTAFAACPASIDLAVLEGLHTIEVRAKDSLENISDVATYTWTVDITVPEVTITSPAGAALLNDATPTIEGSATESSDVTVKIWSGSDMSVAPLATQAATPGPVSGRLTSPPSRTVPTRSSQARLTRPETRAKVCRGVSPSTPRPHPWTC